MAKRLTNFSAYRDHFISSAGAKDIMSASTMIVISSIPITVQLDEVEIMSQVGHCFSKFSFVAMCFICIKFSFPSFGNICKSFHGYLNTNCGLFDFSEFF